MSKNYRVHGPMICADDNKSVRESLVRLLGVFYQTEVDAVENGRLLVEKVREIDYSLVVTDYEMPFMNGLEAIREIRKFNRDVPIILVSGREPEEIEEAALEAGASAYSFKLRGDLIELVNNLLDTT